jgi:hypothetical protein
MESSWQLGGGRDRDILSRKKLVALLEPKVEPSLGDLHQSQILIENLTGTIRLYNKELPGYQKSLSTYYTQQLEGESEPRVRPELSEQLYRLLAYLDTIEHSIYTWLQPILASDLTEKLMFELLVEVQVAHTGHRI